MGYLVVNLVTSHSSSISSFMKSWSTVGAKFASNLVTKILIFLVLGADLRLVPVLLPVIVVLFLRLRLEVCVVNPSKSSCAACSSV